MKTKHYILLAIGGLVAFFAGFFIGKDHMDKPPGTVTETKETTVDTITHSIPTPTSVSATGARRYTLPVYRFAGGEAGGEPRQRRDDDNISADTVFSTGYYGTGAGGEPRCRDDSATVEVPIIQRHYADSTYEAWVSGPLDPRLDSVRVYERTTTIRQTERAAPKRWHIGVTAGYGYGPKGFQPYIGVGITYSIISF